MKLTKIGILVRDAWLIVGVTVLLFCLLEIGISLAFVLKKQLSGSELSTADTRVRADTYADSAWVRDYFKEFHRPISARYQWRSYVYWRGAPYHGEHINVDADGIRLTTVTEPKLQASQTSAKIFMFGGSTMWGEGVRDAFTIPSLLTRELRSKGVAPEIINFGEGAYVSTQEVITLMLRLQRGDIPDLVIFYDGFNDTYSAYQQHVAGLPQNEFNRVKEFNLAHPQKVKERRALFFQDLVKGLATVQFLEGLLRRAGVWNNSASASKPLHLDDASSEKLSRQVLDTYRSNIEIVKALSEHYRFRYLFYWQPTVFQKTHVTPYERGQRGEWRPFGQFLLKTYSGMRQNGLVEPSEHFHDLSLVFSEMHDPVYIDGVHLGEAGNEIVAKRMANDALAAIIKNK